MLHEKQSIGIAIIHLSTYAQMRITYAEPVLRECARKKTTTIWNIKRKKIEQKNRRTCESEKKRVGMKERTKMTGIVIVRQGE